MRFELMPLSTLGFCPHKKTKWTEPPFGAMPGMESHFCDGSWLTFSPTAWGSDDCDRRRSDVSHSGNNFSTCHKINVANQMWVWPNVAKGDFIVYFICPRVKMAAQLHTSIQVSWKHIVLFLSKLTLVCQSGCVILVKPPILWSTTCFIGSSLSRMFYTSKISPYSPEYGYRYLQMWSWS